MSIVTSPIDLSLLPVPDALENLDFETVYDSRVEQFIQLWPRDIQQQVRETLQLESEPITLLLQENAYRELIIRQRINETVRRVLLAFARGSDLDHIGARYYVYRLVVQQADPSASPPKPLIMESDEAFLERIQDAYEGLSVAGPRGAYVFHARSADGRVLDAVSISPEPCDVVVAVLSAEGDGTASEELLEVVRRALNDDEVRPIADRLTVQSSEIIPFEVRARLHMNTDGPGRLQALQLATENVQKFVGRRRRQGWSVWLSKLDALMHVEGVERVEILSPATDVELTPLQSARCISIDITDADGTVLL